MRCIEMPKVSWISKKIRLFTVLCLSSSLVILSGCRSNSVDTNETAKTQSEDTFSNSTSTSGAIETPEMASSNLQSWDTPYNDNIETLIQDFSLSMIQEEDLQKYFAVDETVDGFDVDYVAKRLNISKEQVEIPTIESQTNTVLEEIAKISFGLSFRYNQNNEAVQDENSIDYKNLKLIRIDQPAPKMYNSELYQDLLKEQAKTYGAETFFNRTALYEMNGQYYIFPFTLIKYGDVIKIYSLRVDSVAIIMVAPVLSEEEYNKAIQDTGVWVDK